MYNKIKVIDSHVHFELPFRYKDLKKMMKDTKTDICNLVCLYDGKYSSSIIDSLLAKEESNNDVYVFGSLDLANYYLDRKDLGLNMVNHVKRLMKLGCDGIKMLEGKPSSRKKYPIPDFDVLEFDPYFKYMEENNIPLIWHVNDPEEFWDINLVPDWAKNSGWYYSDEYVNNIDQYNQIKNVLLKHPLLNVTFAHFYFMSKKLDELGEMFDLFPNMKVDITPGIEMFESFSKNNKEAKDFFIKYQDRIVYGTDISLIDYSGNGKYDYEDSTIRAMLCRKFLSNKRKMILKGNKNSLLGENDLLLYPLGLSKDIQEKIFFSNFIKSVGPIKKVDLELLLDECIKTRKKINYLMTKPFNKNKEKDYSRIETVEKNIYKRLGEK